MDTSGGPPEQLVAEGAAFGLDLRDHKPRRMRPDDVTQADLIVGMARQHVREAILLDQSAFPRSFTLREFVRRAEKVGPRPDHQTLVEWLSEVGAARRHADLVGESAADDVPDPMGGPPEGYRLMLDDVSRLTAALYGLMWGTRGNFVF
jgi:protein-tyrosine phosphatase